ncbi:MAG: type I restriction-modification system subunit M [Anaerolineae bacterium]|nr:type I restriction-modification system subunit M [Anaerolineae bacterium]
MVANNTEIEKRLWEAADNLRANSKLRSSEYSIPVLGLIFLRYADHRFAQAEQQLQGKGGRRRGIAKTDFQAMGVMYLPEAARFSRLMQLPEGENIGKAINEAMKAIEDENEALRGVLPKQYNRFENDLLISLMKALNFPMNGLDGDVFGKIYEYFLGNFAMTEGQKGGEFFTPISIVKLIVEIIEPFHGYILDPACGSGGMFVQSAEFVKQHRHNPSAEIAIYGQERVGETVRLCKMNLAVHGLEGDIREGNTYYDDIHRGVGKFDFVMANPPFNVDKVDKAKIKADTRRFPFGMPNVDNANYLWIQLFYSSLNETGRAGFVMASSALDARGSERNIRQKLIEEKSVDVIIQTSTNFFYTVTLACSIWFFDKGKRGSRRENQILFINAKDIYQRVDRAHREFTPQQIEFLANIVRLYRAEEPEFIHESEELINAYFPDGKLVDVLGLCKVATLEEVQNQDWSLNPGRYVGTANQHEVDFDFLSRLQELNEQFELLNAEAHDLEQTIAENMQQLLKG